MITVYKTRVIPREAEIVLNNDAYFNKYTIELLDNRALPVIYQIDGLTVMPADPETLSVSCKTVLNILYEPRIIFNIEKCSNKALNYIYSFETANICAEHPCLPDNDTSLICVYTGEDTRYISDTQTLIRWWLGKSETEL